MIASIKPASLEDVNEIVSLREAFYAIDAYPFDRDQQIQITSEFLGNPAYGLCWNIFVEKSMVGYICLTYDYSFEFGGRIAFIDEFYLQTPYRGQGLGDQVLGQLIDEARLLGLKTLMLEAERHNEAGNKLYRKHRFEDTGRYLLYRKI